MNRLLSKIVEYKLSTITLVVVAIGAFYYGYVNSRADNQEIIPPEIVEAKRGNIALSVTGSGQIYARSQVDIKPQVAGDGVDVLKVAVKNDQDVKKGDLIAVLDYTDAQKSVRNAELDLKSAELRYDAIKEDYEEDKADAYDKKLQKITIEQKRNSLIDARENLSDYYIKAPFDGIVTGLNVEAGSSVSRTDVLASVITTEMYAKVSLNEVDAISVDVDDEAVLTFDAIENLKIKGKVSKIDTIGTVEQGVVYYEAEVSFENNDERLNPGMSVSAEILTESKNDVITIPASAIKTGLVGEYVQVVDENKKVSLASEGKDDSNIYYIEKSVKTGLNDGINVEILSGISESEKIIVKAASVKAKTDTANQSQGLFNSSVRVPGSGGGLGR